MGIFVWITFLDCFKIEGVELGWRRYNYFSVVHLHKLVVELGDFLDIEIQARILNLREDLLVKCNK